MSKTVDDAAIRQRIANSKTLHAPRLRFDKVALGLINRVREALKGSVPQNTFVIFTVTAPIRLASRTAAAIEALAQEYLADGSTNAHVERAIHGNTVRIWVTTGNAKATSRVIGFVHNPDADPGVLFEITRAMLE